MTAVLDRVESAADVAEGLRSLRVPAAGGVDCFVWDPSDAESVSAANAKLAEVKTAGSVAHEVDAAGKPAGSTVTEITAETASVMLRSAIQGG